MRNNREKIRLFQNDYLEKYLSRTNAWLPALFWSLVIGSLLYRSSSLPITWQEYTGLFLLSLFVWSLAEYCFHRFLFHIPIIGEKTERLNFVFHGAHHEDPHDLERGLLPVAVATVYCTGLYLLFYSLIGPRLSETFFAFFSLNLLTYDYFHFSNHVRYPKSRLGKYLRTNHFIHHVHPHVNFGVTSPFWDKVFNTYASQKNVSKRPSYSLCATSAGEFKSPLPNSPGHITLSQKQIEDDLREIFLECYPGEVFPENLKRKWDNLPAESLSLTKAAR